MVLIQEMILLISAVTMTMFLTSGPASPARKQRGIYKTIEIFHLKNLL